MKYSDMTQQQLRKELETLDEQYDDFRKLGLSLNMSRGKPSDEQIKTVMGILDCVDSKTDYISKEGTNCLNYGSPTGLLECKELFAEMLGIDPAQIILGGNSSLELMYDYICQCMLKGAGGAPWASQGNISFLCPVPGYDRHFKICEFLGINMINVPLLSDGPDMNIVKELCKDSSVKGMFCVPKYSNPTGITYSDEVCRELASMKTADDFRIIWDNAYVVHDLFGKGDFLPEILSLCEKAGNPDRAVEFSSTSKISLSGAGISAVCANKNNYEMIKERFAAQTIGHDKINQLRHAVYFRDLPHIKAHMKELSDIISPKFEAVISSFEKQLGESGTAKWTSPNGGYFISLDVMPGTASRVYELCKNGGVTLTKAGASFPYGKDPQDTNIRIAPTCPSEQDLRKATELLCICVKKAAAEKLLSDQ